MRKTYQHNIIVRLPEFFNHHLIVGMLQKLLISVREIKLFVMWNEFRCFQNQNHNSNRCVKKRNSDCFKIV